MRWLVPPVLALILALGMMVAARLLPWPTMLPEPWNAVLGWLLIALGLGLMVAAAWLFRRRRTNIHPFGKPDVLITEGVFRLSRNPIYLGLTVILVGVALQLNALAALPLAIVFFLVADRWYIPIEEQLAESAFGEAYETYRQRVRRWL